MDDLCVEIYLLQRQTILSIAMYAVGKTIPDRRITLTKKAGEPAMSSVSTIIVKIGRRAAIRLTNTKNGKRQIRRNEQCF